MIATWVLILTLGSQSFRGVSLATVPGYTDKVECQSAGERWKLEAKQGYNEISAMPLYYCIPGPAPLTKSVN